MPIAATLYFGNKEYTDDSVIRTPHGIPGFAEENSFLLLQVPGQYPLVYLQSTRTPGVCFPALPALALQPNYVLELTEEDSGLLETNARPAIGPEVLALCLIGSSQSGPTANLLAPVVVNLARRVALQSINLAGDYSCRQLLEEAVSA